MIVFVIAMESEAAPLISEMKNTARAEVHGRTVVSGTLCGRATACVVCGVGKVNAAAGAQYAIDILGADKLVNIGVAGGLNRGVEIGALYGISAAVQYDFDLVELNGTPMGTLNEYSEPYLPLATGGQYPLRKLGSGDRFNDDIKDFELLTRELGADIRDMEGGAIAQVCAHAGVDFYSFKVISDLAESGSTPEQFKRNLALCAETLKGNIEKIFEAVAND